MPTLIKIDESGSQGSTESTQSTLSSGQKDTDMGRITNGIDRKLTGADRYGLPQELAPGVTGIITHSAEAIFVHTRIVLQEDLAIILAGDAAAKAGGAKLFDLPGIRMKVHAARIGYSLTLSAAAMSTTAGEIGLGTSIASGAAAVLGGTAAFEDILEGGANGRSGAVLANIGAAGIIGATNYDAGRELLTAVATSVYLNAATTFADSDPSNLIARAGTEIEIWWTPVES